MADAGRLILLFWHRKKIQGVASRRSATLTMWRSRLKSEPAALTKNLEEGKMREKLHFPSDLLSDKYKYKCKGCGNIIAADPRDLPRHCPECGTEYAYMLIPPAA